MRKVWTGAQELELRRLHKLGYGPAYVGRCMGRSEGSVRARMYLLRILVVREGPRIAQSRWSRVSRSLAWRHGDLRASAIMAARDPATEADVASWNRLGSGRERAA